MRRSLIVILLSSTAFGIASWGSARPISGSAALAGGASQSDGLSTQEFNDRVEARLKQRLGSRASEPAAVFKNLKIDWLKDEPADNFLGIMNGGYARALGVRCTHCHVKDDFASDDLRPKRVAREMAVMHHGINQQLARMEHLEDPPEDRFINCATCHRGRVDPHDPPAR